MKDEGLKASAIACHMGDNEQVQALAQTTIDTFGGIDIIVNNAAANPVFGPIQNAGDDA